MSGERAARGPEHPDRGAEQPDRGAEQSCLGVEIGFDPVVIREPSAAEDALSQHFPELRLDSAEPGEFRARFGLARTARFAFAEYTFETPGSAHAASQDIVIVESAGRRYRVEHAGHDVDLSVPYLAPTESLAASWDAVRARAVSLDLDGVEALARSAADDPDFTVRRLGTQPVSAEAARYWRATTQGIRRAMVSAPEAFDSPLVAQAAFNRLATAFLHGYPSGWQERGSRRPGGRGTVEAAIAFMREHAAEPITAHDVASAVYISTRGLSAAFVRELGEPPRDTLRRIRLEGVRADLLAAERGASTAVLARRWGFLHLSRFAAEYRRAYGELPSETLRR